MRVTSLAGVVLLLVLVTGCARETAEPADTVAGAETAAPAATAEPQADATANPCSAVPASEVSAMVGMTMTREPGDDEHGCSYVSEDGQVRLVVRRMDADGFALVAQSSDAQPVQGIGERAIWDTSISKLMAVKGERMLDIIYDESAEISSDRRATEAQKRERTIAVGQKVMPAI